MTQILVGKVLEEEKECIRNLHKRLEALKVIREALLVHQIRKETVLSNRVEKDYQCTLQAYEQWWKSTAQKYQWQKEEHAFWSIDFESNEICLIVSQ